jgi:hypothetical protein
VHDGSNGRWFSIAWLAPEIDLGVAAACNEGGEAGSAACNDAVTAVLKEVLTEEGFQQPKTAGLPERRAQPDVILPDAERQGYVAVYADQSGRKLIVAPEPAGGLWVQLNAQPKLPIFYAGRDRFFARNIAVDFQFERAAEGMVVAVRAFQNGRQMRLHRTREALP